MLPSSARTAVVALPVGGELAKALIINTTTGESHQVMYNPEELKLEQGNNFAEVGIPGLDTPPVQYVRGKARTLSMELFFDTYASGADVRAFTAPVVQLLDKDPQTLAPPILLFSLGRFQFQCVLVNAAQRYTMFLRDGTPVRSTVSVSLQEYVRVDVQISQGLFFGSPTVSAAVNAAVSAAVGSTTTHTVGAGDTLSGLAGAYLGDPSLWRQIAQANQIVDPLSLQVGQVLRIPSTGGGQPAVPGRGQP